MTRITRVLVLAAAAVGCGGSDLPSNWVTVPNRQSHEAHFPIATGAHATADCNACHGSYDTFKRFDCTTSACHVGIDQRHLGMAGFATDGPTCLGCHPKGGLGLPANHDTAFFPRGSGTKHDTVACTQCHTNLATPRDPTAFACYTCHSTQPAGWTHPDPVGTVAILTIHASQNSSTRIDVTDPTTCLRCHADSQVNAVASHPGGGGGFGRSAHDGAGCLTCHQAMRTDKTFGANFSVTGAIGSGTGCGTCHATQPN
ncbi:MAG TPA: multiheme c-type cytochrome [Anaeromyxobacteraceae bacterium]|nr:multiheme c-type cytochrome [Anaeromyxobacteraceae bacterium]